MGIRKVLAAVITALVALPAAASAQSSVNLSATYVSETAAKLQWSGARGTRVRLFRNGEHIALIQNDGVHQVSPGNGTWSFKICERKNVGGVCSNTVSLTFPHVTTTPTGKASGAYGVPDSKTLNFDFKIITPYPDRLEAAKAAGYTKVIVWLWGHGDDGTNCVWDASNAQIEQQIRSLMASPAYDVVWAYQLSDEPGYSRATGCGTQIEDMHRERTNFIHSIDPNAKTYTVIATWDNVEGYPYQYWLQGEVDRLGFDIYPVSGGRDSGPRLEKGIVDTAIGKIESLGIQEWVAVPGAFEVFFSDTSAYRVPTPGQLDWMLDRYSVAKGIFGQMTYHWSQQAAWMTDWAAAHPELFPVFTAFKDGPNAWEPAACDDTFDNDGDGKVDHSDGGVNPNNWSSTPNDDGCTSLTDTTE